MPDNHTTNEGSQQALGSSATFKQLDRLAGSWHLSGGIHGTVTYAWMEGKFFLIQHVDLVHDAQTIKGMEIIGQLRPFGEEPSADIHSRFYDTLGNTLDYVYELDGDTLTIWGGAKGSPAYFRGTFSADGNSCVGGWVYPGGGYESIMTRARE